MCVRVVYSLALPFLLSCAHIPGIRSEMQANQANNVLRAPSVKGTPKATWGFPISEPFVGIFHNTISRDTRDTLSVFDSQSALDFFAEKNPGVIPVRFLSRSDSPLIISSPQSLYKVYGKIDFSRYYAILMLAQLPSTNSSARIVSVHKVSGSLQVYPAIQVAVPSTPATLPKSTAVHLIAMPRPRPTVQVVDSHGVARTVPPAPSAAGYYHLSDGLEFSKFEGPRQLVSNPEIDENVLQNWVRSRLDSPTGIKFHIENINISRANMELNLNINEYTGESRGWVISFEGNLISGKFPTQAAPMSFTAPSVNHFKSATIVVSTEDGSQLATLAQ
ncbi:MAG: hypothetical protein JWM80_6619 [Cyanobacteria bacterium RYN_339]|nr:hypothetical protein [Cyanobacteria bacterium RYN_339]